jgi:hypothetical protein
MTPSDNGVGVASESRTRAEARAARIDAAAEHMLRRLEPMSFRLAVTSSEREAGLRLRYEAVIRQGWRTPEEMPEGIEWEPDDDVAHHLVGWLDSRAIANLRILYPQPGVRLPVERVYGVALPPGRAVQVDRMCVDPSYSSRPSELFMGLLCAGWLEFRKLGYQEAVGFDTVGMIRLHRLLGMNLFPLSEPGPYWGEERIPTLLTIDSITDRFFEFVYADR